VNWIDWILIAIVGASLVAGLWRGAVRTVFSLAGFVVGFYLAVRESGAVALVLERWLSPKVAAALGFLLVFLGIALAFALAAWLLRKALGALALSWLDRLGGAALGLARGLAIVGVLALAVEGMGGLAATRDSTTYPWALRSGQVLLRVIPEDARARLHWDELRSRIPAMLREREDDQGVI
jgi:membrane protein required for colicin V production